MKNLKKCISLILCNLLFFFTFNAKVFATEYHIGSGQPVGGIYYDTLQEFLNAGVLLTGDSVILYQDDKSIIASGGFPISGLEDIILKSSTTKMTVSSSTVKGRIFKVNNNSVVTIDSIIFSSASVDSNDPDGVVFYINQSSVNFNNSEFLYNNGMRYGGVFYIEGSSVTFSGASLFEGNKAGSGGNGGAIYSGGGTNPSSTQKSSILFSSVTFRNNSALLSGGAVSISIANSSLNFTDFTLFEGNKSLTSGGGAIYAGSGLKVDFIDVIFKNNVSVNTGGAMYLSGSNTNITGEALFEGNIKYKYNYYGWRRRSIFSKWNDCFFYCNIQK